VTDSKSLAGTVVTKLQFDAIDPGRTTNGDHAIRNAGSIRIVVSICWLPLRALGLRRAANAVELDDLGIEAATSVNGISDNRPGHLGISSIPELGNGTLASACQPLPRHTKAQSWHTQSEFVTNTAQHFRAVRLHVSEREHNEAQLTVETVPLDTSYWRRQRPFSVDNATARACRSVRGAPRPGRRRSAACVPPHRRPPAGSRR
jgi:hypothetical protein